MKIGEVAKQLNIPPSTIRYYEKRGLLQLPERALGVRVFGSSALATLRFIKLGQAAGFTIDELKSLLDRYNQSSSDEGLWQPDVESKRTELREKIRELEQADVVLGRLMNCRCQTIEQCVTDAVEEVPKLL